jgi:hypothetical protein
MINAVFPLLTGSLRSAHPRKVLWSKIVRSGKRFGINFHVFFYHMCSCREHENVNMQLLTLYLHFQSCVQMWPGQKKLLVCFKHEESAGQECKNCAEYQRSIFIFKGTLQVF